MRRALIVIGGVIGVIVLIVAGVIGYAYLNLNSIIAANRERLLARASDAIGRPVQAAEIKASLGRGVSVEITGVKLDDDPDFSQLPFVQADRVFLKVEFIPLLFKEIKVTELVLSQPQIRIIRNPAGTMNVSTIARKGGGERNHNRHKSGGGWFGGGLGSSRAGGETEGGGVDLQIKTFTIEDGQISYIDAQSGGAQVRVNALNLKIENFSFTAPFNLELDLAAMGANKNLELTGTAGPIVQDGAVDVGAIPLAMEATVGPLTLAQMKSVPELAKSIPPALALSDEVEVKAKASGTVNAITFEAASDLTASRVTFAPNFDKPSGVPLKFTASGVRTADKLSIVQANLTLANLVAKITDIVIATGKLSARVDTNRFDLPPIARLVPPAQRYNPSGTAEIHTVIAMVNKQPQLDGTIVLADVSAAPPGGKAPPVSDISGTIKLDGNTATIGPLDFKLGSGHAQLRANADSIRPVHAAYRLSVDQITLAELAPSRQNLGNENLRQVAANGLVSNVGGALSASTKLTASSGMVANVPFTLLALDASFQGNRVAVNSLKFGAFDGSIGTAGVATIGASPTFDFKVNAQNVNMQQALASQHSKAANTIRGSLTGNIQIAGEGKGLDQVKPTLRGSGRAQMDNGKLIGVNVVAQALRKVDNVPGIGALVPGSVVANHPELFKSPDTDIEQASLTFQIAGPRIISHDIVAQSTDYSIFGDGWFDLDKNLDLSAKIVMSKAFSSELVGAKHNVVYVTNNDGQIEIPVRVSGQLPHPAIAPDLGDIAQRAATHAVQGHVGELLQKKGLGGILKKNGLGGLLGGSSW